MEGSILSPVEVVEFTIATGEGKVKKSKQTILISAILSGAFITLGAMASLAATYAFFAPNDLGIATYGIGKLVQGILFSVGLLLIVFLGTDLFTGNILITMAVLQKRVSFMKMVSNWGLVWIGNLVGAIVVGYIFYKSGVFNWTDGLFGGIVLKTAYVKANLDFSTAFFSGIVCNLLVCLTILMTYATKNPVAKIGIIILGITVFVASGSEHIVANMGYFAAAFFAKADPSFVAVSTKGAAGVLEALSPMTILTKNFIPVTLGNIIGGMIFVAAPYYFMVKDKLNKN